MREWSFWEWMAYVTLALATLIEALEGGLKEAPQVAAKIPEIVPSEIAPIVARQTILILD
jgi:hypothetical protein